VLLDSPALRPIDYCSDASVILSVNTSYIAIGYILSQGDNENIKLRHYSRFGLITLNEREACFSQPKLELYGLYRSLRALRLYLIGLRNLIIEVDAKYIKGMLLNPDIAPSASINRWIVLILIFHFTLIHVPGTFHSPDGLSQRRKQPGDLPEPDDNFNDWIDQVHGFLHMILHIKNRSGEQPPAVIHILAGLIIEDDEEDFDRTTISQPDTYNTVPRTERAQKADNCIRLVLEWHNALQRPADMTDAEYEAFLRYCTEFFVDSDRLWHKDRKGEHRLVVSQDHCMFILASAHDDMGHHSYFATHAHIALRYWWPFMGNDIAWFVKTCHICQT